MPDWLDREIVREYHPVSMYFPLLEGEEFDKLKASIAENGLIESIWLHPDGCIIDGRNRHRACILTETRPEFRTWNGEGSLLAFVIALNIDRRHLSASQRAALAVSLLPALEAEARERQGTRTDLGRNLPAILPEGGEAREQAGKLLDVGARYIQDAKRLSAEAPELFEQVRSGDLSIQQAKRKLRQAEAPFIPELPMGTYDVIYADPPWRYDFSMDGRRQIENQYPTLTVEELCALDVPAIAAPDSVLFLWATSPKLLEALRVIDAWGFSYTTSMVWDKEIIGMGYYARQQHEFLLIAKRGALPVPAPDTRPSSVIRQRRGRHSEKPALVYELLERMYPGRQRVELFARQQRDGWAHWGDEA